MYSNHRRINKGGKQGTPKTDRTLSFMEKNGKQNSMQKCRPIEKPYLRARLGHVRLLGILPPYRRQSLRRPTRPVDVNRGRSSRQSWAVRSRAMHVPVSLDGRTVLLTLSPDRSGARPIWAYTLGGKRDCEHRTSNGKEMCVLVQLLERDGASVLRTGQVNKFNK